MNSQSPEVPEPSENQDEPTFKIGDLVWAKMKRFPPWPGKVANPPQNLRKPKGSKSKLCCIFFFGSNNFAWVETFSVRHYEEHLSLKTSAKTTAFKDACAAIEAYKDKIAQGEVPPEDMMLGTSEDETLDVAVEEPVEVEGEESQKKKRGRKPNKRDIEENGESVKTEKVVEPKKRRINGPKATTEPLLLPSAIHTASLVRKSPAASLLDRPATINKSVESPINITQITQTLKDKNITPSTLKFGFLGLGNMGSGIVKNLLNSGHKVFVWNRSTEKCKAFIEAGAEKGMTPGDVIQSADVTFCCVSDPLAAREIVFGNCGVLHEITASKSYVEMTGTDADTSIDMAEAICSKGGRYLEAQIQGSKSEAENGALVILAAGDRGLYDDCQSAFQAMGKQAFFLGDVGNASKMHMVMQLIQGITIAALAEGMALADRAGLQQRDVVEILSLTNISSKLLLQKSNAIIDANFPTNHLLQHMQKDLSLVLGMGNLLEQPLPLAATANEIYKHAKRLGYSEHDVAAVYIRARF